MEQRDIFQASETNDTHFFGRPRSTAPHPLTPQVSPYVFDPNDDLRRMATQTFVAGHNVILYGETGNGKTEHIKWMCAQLGLPLYQVQGRSDLCYDDLTGDWRPNTNATEPAPFVFCEGSLAIACRDGGVFLLDEAASVKQGVLNGLNELLNNKSLVINTDRGHRVIERHPRFQVAMTFNPPDRYSGNQELNLAFLNRFYVFKWDYLNVKQEIELLNGLFSDMDKSALRNIAAFASEIRSNKTSADGARYVMSHRDSIKICEQIRMGASVNKAVEMVVLSVVELIASDELPAIREMAINRFGRS